MAVFDDLTKDEQEDFNECWDDLYIVAKDNFINDVHGKLADKFLIDLKLVTRETSAFDLVENTGSGKAGIKLFYYLPKYAKVRINTIDVYSLATYASPGLEIKIYDTDENGELLYDNHFEVTAGRNSLGIDTDFEANNLYVTYSVPSYRLYKTENKYYANGLYYGWDKLACSYPCYGSPYTASIIQVNGGGLNIHFVVACSIEKFICENINIFKIAFWNRIAVDILRERIVSDKFNRFTTFTSERAKELMDFYNAEYDKHLHNSVRNLRIKEDHICFNCKSAVSTATVLP